MSKNRYRPIQVEVLDATARASRARTGAPRVETQLGSRYVSSSVITAAVMLRPVSHAHPHGPLSTACGMAAGIGPTGAVNLSKS